MFCMLHTPLLYSLCAEVVENLEQLDPSFYFAALELPL